MKNQHFWHKKLDSTLFHDFSASQLSYPANNVQNTTFQLRRNSGETDLVTQIHQNMPKIGCFWPFSHFFCFWGPFFEKLDLRICLFIHQMWDEISQMTNICHKCTQNGTFKFDQKRNCPLSNALCRGALIFIMISVVVIFLFTVQGSLNQTGNTMCSTACLPALETWHLISYVSYLIFFVVL